MDNTRRILQEMDYFFGVCYRDYPDEFRSLITLDNGYTNAQRYSAIAETAYFHQHGRLPAWASVIESVESDGVGGWIFVHRDTGQDN